MPLVGIKLDIDRAIFLPGIITEVKATGNTYLLFRGEQLSEVRITNGKRVTLALTLNLPVCGQVGVVLRFVGRFHSSSFFS